MTSGLRSAPHETLAHDPPRTARRVRCDRLQRDEHRDGRARSLLHDVPPSGRRARARDPLRGLRARRARALSRRHPAAAHAHRRAAARARAPPGTAEAVTEIGLFWLLLPVAAAVSWYLARRSNERSSGAQVHRLRTNYFRGLNYLLNEQPDKAIEVFLQIAEVDSDTVETHLALGNLFRRRGEVDRAIRVHQNLISRPTLSAEQKTAALLELGEDYMRAGLLDRAETLFSDLVNIDARAPSALKHLISIYQQERDWHKAIDHARRLEQATGESQGRVIGQYYCELTEHARGRHDLESARRFLAEAFACEANCVRGRIIEGQMAIDADEPERALASFERVVEQDMEFVPEILKPALRCYEQLQAMPRAREFLKQ